MEKDVERHSATNNLSQYYYIKIRKIAATENSIPSNFQIPAKVLDKRKKAWDNLFEKYSSMVSEVKLNINTLQPKDQINPPEVMKQRFPMRKPMSMVQYWVDTGNLSHTNCTNNPSHLDSASSIVENDCFESAQNIDSQSLATDPIAEKHSNIAETSGNKNLRIVTSSNSSIDTAAYILANSNVTEKAEAVAIVEGSKINTETHIPTKHPPQIIGTNKNTHNINLARKSNHEKLTVENADFPQSFFSKSYADKITKNFKNVKFDKICENKMSSKSKQHENYICSIFFSDSDESQVSNVENNNGHNVINEINQTANNLSKFLKRKKLYKRSDSPAEFTPVSEDNLSLQTSKILQKCLPLRKSEHPALETPRIGSRFLFRTSCRQTIFKRKLNWHQRVSLISKTDEKNENQELFEPKQKNAISQNSQIQNIINSDIFQTSAKENFTTNNSRPLSQASSKDHVHIKESNFQNSKNSMTQPFLNQSNELQKPQATSSFSSCNDFLKNKFKLKSCKIVVQRLPHKYYFSCKNSIQNITKNKNLIDSVKSKKNQGFNKNLYDDESSIPNIISTNNVDDFAFSKNDLSKNTTNITINNVKTFNNTKSTGDILSCREKERKLSIKMNSDYSSDKLKLLDITGIASNIHPIENILTKRLEVTNNKKSKYVIADSSSDESDSIVPSLHTKSKSADKSKNSKKLSSKNVSYKLAKNVNLKKIKVAESFATVWNSKYLNSSINKDNNQNSSDKQKRVVQKFLKNNGTDDDVQCNKVKENVYLHELKCKKSPSDCNKFKNKIKNTPVISTSSDEEETPSVLTKKKNEAVKLAIKSKKIMKSVSDLLSESKNTPNRITNDRVLVNGVHKKNNNVDINKELSKLVTNCDKINTLNKIQNKKELHADDENFNSDNSEDLDPVFTFISDNEQLSKIPTPPNAENSYNIKKSKLSSIKGIQQRDKSQKVQDTINFKTVKTQKTSTKKRKSFEIDLSSDEECIIPLKKKE